MDDEEPNLPECWRCGHTVDEDEQLDDNHVCDDCNEADREAAERLSDYRFMCR